jgi:hypothetical protein
MLGRLSTMLEMEYTEKSEHILLQFKASRYLLKETPSSQLQKTVPSSFTDLSRRTWLQQPMQRQGKLELT